MNLRTPSIKGLGAGAAALAFGVLTAVSDVQAQTWTQPYTSPTATGDCSALPAALNTGFTTTPVVSRARFPATANNRILKMAFWLNPGEQFNDIYMIEKGTGGSASSNGTARILHYDYSADTLRVIGTLNGVNTGGGGVAEQGLLGIALNPVTFGTDKYIYLSYSTGYASSQNLPLPSDSIGLRVARFTIGDDGMLDMSSRKNLLHIPMTHNARWHTGGAMTIDNFNNLYISTGDNEALATGPGNTADMRGAILRIKLDNSAKGYSIPAGNFGDYWAQVWQDSGLTARAAQYRDTSKVRPELYVKGSRNPYSISVDRYRLGWLGWSECGPDAQRGEEYNITTKPAFSGWPFWAGNAVRQASKANQYNETPDVASGDWGTFNPTTMTTAVPYNNFATKNGVDTLPPMHVPAHSYAQSGSSTCAAGGAPIIRYNGSLSNPGKMPPHLDNTILFADFTGSTIFAKSFDPVTGVAASGSATTVFTMSKSGRPNINNPIDMQQGADGSLYLIDWGAGCCSENPSTSNNGIVRITYTGTCADPARVPVTSSISNKPVSPAQAANWLSVGANSFSITAAGPHEAQILSINGRVLHTFQGEGHKSYTIPALGSGVHLLRVKTTEGMTVRSVASAL